MSNAEWNDVKNIVKSRGGNENIVLGYYSKSECYTDIKHFLFRLSRYKFVVKLMRYEKAVKVLELGCNEAWGSLLLDQNIDMVRYVGVDFDPDVIAWSKENLSSKYDFICDDFFACKAIEQEKFNLIFSLDVIEHIEPVRENEFCQVITSHLEDGGTVVIGTPNINLSPYASEGAKAGHINLYDQKRLFVLMRKYFKNVYIFNMNDEIIHMGFDPMSCYMFAICSNPI